jgi:hypothetical protein
LGEEVFPDGRYGHADGVAREERQMDLCGFDKFGLGGCERIECDLIERDSRARCRGSAEAPITFANAQTWTTRPESWETGGEDRSRLYSRSVQG